MLESMLPQLQMQLPSGVKLGTDPFARPTMCVDLFREAHTTFCQRNGIVVDQNVLQFEGSPIDLHALHTEVLGIGAWDRV